MILKPILDETDLFDLANRRLNGVACDTIKAWVHRNAPMLVVSPSIG
jgi:hypothetical protein